MAFLIVYASITLITFVIVNTLMLRFSGGIPFGRGVLMSLLWPFTWIAVVIHMMRDGEDE